MRVALHLCCCRHQGPASGAPRDGDSVALHGGMIESSLAGTRRFGGTGSKVACNGDEERT
eukprot:scaffold48_cov311-Pinguiococcus_pyrenoidosus.AAC.302